MAAARDAHRSPTFPQDAQRPAYTWRKPLLTGHVAASVGLPGAALVLAGLGVAGIFVLEPRLAASAAAATAGQCFTTAEFLPLAVAPSVAVALLVVNLALGIYKPGRRLPPRGSKEPS